MRGSGKIANSLARLVEGFLAGAFVFAIANLGYSGAGPAAETMAVDHASLVAGVPASRAG